MARSIYFTGIYEVDHSNEDQNTKLSFVPLNTEIYWLLSKPWHKLWLHNKQVPRTEHEYNVGLSAHMEGNISTIAIHPISVSIYAYSLCGSCNFVRFVLVTHSLQQITRSSRRLLLVTLVFLSTPQVSNSHVVS